MKIHKKNDFITNQKQHNTNLLFILFEKFVGKSNGFLNTTCQNFIDLVLKK